MSLPILTAFLTTINLLLGIFALYVNNFYANQRERRKETRSKIDQILNQIGDIENNALKYHSNNEFNERDQDSLLRSIERLSASILRIPFFKNDPEIAVEIAKFRISITDFNMDEDDFHTVQFKSPDLTNISRNKENILTTLERKYDSLFPIQINSWIGRLLGR